MANSGQIASLEASRFLWIISCKFVGGYFSQWKNVGSLDLDLRDYFDLYIFHNGI